jgi:ferritin-like metal-binding protein YciE
MPINGLQDLMVQGLQAVYDAEQQGLQAAPSIQERATNPELKQKLQERVQRGQEQLQRLEQALRAAGAELRREPNEVAQGILRTGEKIMSETQDPDARDAGIIASAQIALHYHMAAYGTLRSYADALGNREASQMLQQTLDERKQQDQDMTRLAEQVVNPQAK